MKRTFIGGVVAGVVAVLLTSAVQPAVAATPKRQGSNPSSVTVPEGFAAGRYIVLYRRAAAGSAATLAAAAGVRPRITYNSVLKGFAAKLDTTQLRALRSDPRVDRIIPDGVATASDTQYNPVEWGLDRIDQPRLPLSRTYSSAGGNGGAGVKVYVLDTGLNTTHTEFAGRVAAGRNFTDHIPAGGTRPADPPIVASNVSDCDGHGTHVSGTIGGTSYGVAKKVTIVPIRVLNCEGLGLWSQVIGGLDYVAAQQAADPTHLAIANMSLGGDYSSEINEAVQGAIDAGVTFAVSAGNDGDDACDYSPASLSDAITVGATNINDEATGFSNFGRCLDIYAPGRDIRSAWIGSNVASNSISGTSMASPHVAGTLATLRKTYPTDTPAQLRDRLVALGQPDVLRYIATELGDPNLLLQSVAAPLTPDTTVPIVRGIKIGATRCRVVTTISATDGFGVGVRGVAFRYDTTPLNTTLGRTVNSGTTITTVQGSGTWYLHFRVVDKAGNASRIYNSVAIPTDCTVPGVAGPTVKKISRTRLDVRPRGVDSHSGYAGSFVVFNKSATSVTGNWYWVAPGKSLTSPALGKGVWYIHIVAKDKAGNISAWRHFGKWSMG